jgi:cytochrome c oxidase cbb3-type subunit 4
MAIETIINDAGIVTTVISFITFIGILWWTFGFKRSRDFDAVAYLPFADDIDEAQEMNMEKRHV